MATMLRKEHGVKGREGGSKVMAVMQVEDAMAWSRAVVLGLARSRCVLIDSEGGAKSVSRQIGCGM